jgi:hypothetical protein
MKITANNFAFELTEKEVGVWMAALRLASKASAAGTIPHDSCPFLLQHGELVRLTGYGAGDHERLKEEVLKPKVTA